MKHNYHERKQARIDNAKKQADKNKQASVEYQKMSDSILHHIPPGQPILLGHHSEKKHRSALQRSNENMRRSIESTDKAAYYEEKATAIESNNAISSDNPLALELLKKKVEQLTQMQNFMKKTNKLIRKGDKDGFLRLQGATEAMWKELTTSDSKWQIGYPRYRLANNNAAIRNTKQRIEDLEKMSTKSTTEKNIKGIKLIENVEANRIQLIFPEKPNEEVRKKLRKKGFIFCFTEMAWQRHLNNAGIWAANEFLKEY